MEHEERKGDWIQTYTGRVFWPLDPRPDEVCIADIAHSLANQCRFAGHCRKFYSVAQHSVLVAGSRFSQYEKRAGLLHDASEAYLVDLPRPVKRVVQGYKEAEERVTKAIAEHFGVQVYLPQIKTSDEEALATEKRDLLSSCERQWGLGQGADVKEWVLRIEPWDPERSERRFLEMAASLSLLGAHEALEALEPG